MVYKIYSNHLFVGLFIVQIVLRIYSTSINETRIYKNKINLLQSDNIPAEEILSLQDLYLSTNGNNWNWRAPLYGIPWIFTANCNPCNENWQGVTCKFDPSSSSQHVVELSLSFYNLNGTLPSSLMSLTKLEQFVVSRNHLFGKLIFYTSTIL